MTDINSERGGRRGSSRLPSLARGVGITLFALLCATIIAPRYVGFGLGLLIRFTRPLMGSTRQPAAGALTNEHLRSAFEEGKVFLPDGHFGRTVDVARPEMFRFDMSQGNYPFGTIVRFSDLYLTEYPSQAEGVWHMDHLLESAQRYVDLGETPIIVTSNLARRIIEATPGMGKWVPSGMNGALGSYVMYSVSEMLGVVQPNPCWGCVGSGSHIKQVLLVTEVTIGGRKISQDGWQYPLPAAPAPDGQLR
jgi:hypothetical protein